MKNPILKNIELGSVIEEYVGRDNKVGGVQWTVLKIREKEKQVDIQAIGSWLTFKEVPLSKFQKLYQVGQAGVVGKLGYPEGSSIPRLIRDPS